MSSVKLTPEVITPGNNNLGYLYRGLVKYPGVKIANYTGTTTFALKN